MAYTVLISESGTWLWFNLVCYIHPLHNLATGFYNQGLNSRVSLKLRTVCASFLNLRFSSQQRYHQPVFESCLFLVDIRVSKSCGLRKRRPERMYLNEVVMSV